MTSLVFQNIVIMENSMTSLDFPMLHLFFQDRVIMKKIVTSYRFFLTWVSDKGSHVIKTI